MKNELARELSLAEGKIQYDNSVKRVLANKRILAWILKYVTEEFAGMSVDEIKTCIGSDIEISEIGVLPGRTNRREMEKIRGEAQEDAVPGEGELSFDIRFSAYLRGKKERIKLLINVEAQKNFYPGYSLTTRGQNPQGIQYLDLYECAGLYRECNFNVQDHKRRSASRDT